MEIISNTALISINETLVVQVISFLIFLFVINRIMFKPLQKTVEDRNRYLDQIVQDIHDAKEEIDQYTLKIEDRKSTMRAEALEATKELEGVGDLEAEDIMAAAVKAVTTIRDNTQNEVEAQIKEARKQIRHESEALAIQLMEKILDRGISHEAS